MYILSLAITNKYEFDIFKYFVRHKVWNPANPSRIWPLFHFNLHTVGESIYYYLFKVTSYLG